MTIKDKIRQEINTCQNDFYDFVMQRGIANNIEEAEQVFDGDYEIEGDEMNTAWEIGYLAGMRQALAYIVNNKSQGLKKTNYGKQL